LEPGKIIFSSFKIIKFEYIVSVEVLSDKVIVVTSHESLLNTIEYLDVEYSIPIQIFADSLSYYENSDSIHFTTIKGPAQFIFHIQNENYNLKFRSNIDLKFSGHIHIENHEIQVLESKADGSQNLEIDFSNQFRYNPNQLNFDILEYPIQIALKSDSLQIPLKLTVWNKIVTQGMRTGLYEIKSNLASQHKSLFQWISKEVQNKNFDGVVDFSSVFKKQDDAVSASLEYSVGVTIQLNYLDLLTHYNLWNIKSFDKDIFEQDVIVYSTNILNKDDDDKYLLFRMEK
jgi:hypothetical protein